MIQLYKKEKGNQEEFKFTQIRIENLKGINDEEVVDAVKSFTR